MPSLLNRFVGQSNSEPLSEDTDLERFFTDAEQARQLFEDLVRSAPLPKRLLVIHGVGGVGKSTLLKMYRLFCHRHHVPVALVGAEDAPSQVDLLASWAEGLGNSRIRLRSFSSTLDHYRALRAEVEAKAEKAREAMRGAAGELGKAAAKTAVEMAASAIPVIGPFAAALSGAGTEAAIEWLRGFLSKPDLEFYLDPSKRLTNDFLSDLARIAARQRIVLIVDTYEQMTTLDDWMRDITRRLPKNVLLVVSGRVVPKWDRAWPGWIGQAEIVELQEMTVDDLRTLVHRYYAHIRRGEPGPEQVEAIVKFARGLPIAATTVVRLWVTHGIEDFHTVKAEVVADLADRLLEGVPADMRPAFEAAAALRYFNVDSLQALLIDGDAGGLYDELRQWPFIRPRREGLAVHDTMREVINEALQARAPSRFESLHERAAAYYEGQVEKATDDEREQLVLERLYHSVCVDESAGIRLFQEVAEGLRRYRWTDRLRTLVNDANTYPLVQKNSCLWREYYNAQLSYQEARLVEAEKLFQTIGESNHAEPKLRAYALCDLGERLSRTERTSQRGGFDRARRVLEHSLQIAPQMDSKLVFVFSHLSDLYAHRGEWEQAIDLLQRQLQFFRQRDDRFGIVYTLSILKVIYGYQCNWRRAYDIVEEGLQLVKIMPDSSFLRMRLLLTGYWVQLLSGHYGEVERNIRDGLALVEQSGDTVSQARHLGGLGYVLGMQGRFREASCALTESIRLGQRTGQEIEAIVGYLGGVLIRQGELEGAEKNLTQSLAIKRKRHAGIGIPELSNWLGELYELRNDWPRAESSYHQSLEYQWTGRRYFECGALAGLGRIKLAEGDYTAFLGLFAEAEQLAQQYEYNDRLASLRLTQGHITWEGHIPKWGIGLEAASHYYRQALIYALRYNRFLLDEVLWGGGIVTPLLPVIEDCLARGEEGRQMLLTLRDWWQTGVNDVGTPRPDTISLVPEGISLLEAERIAREQEPGDGSPQVYVMDSIEQALERREDNG